MDLNNVFEVARDLTNAQRVLLNTQRMLLNILRNGLHSNQTSLSLSLIDDQISKLLKIKIKNAHIRVHKSCMVCLEDFQLNGEAVMLPCSHFYHFACISQWLKENISCPTCRTRVEVNDDQQTERIINDANENENAVANNENQRVRATARRARNQGSNEASKIGRRRNRRNIRAAPETRTMLTRNMARRIAEQQQQQQQEN